MEAFFCFAAVTDVDTSGIHALKELHRGLQKREVQVVKLHVCLFEVIEEWDGVSLQV